MSCTGVSVDMLNTDKTTHISHRHIWPQKCTYLNFWRYYLTKVTYPSTLRDPFFQILAPETTFWGGIFPGPIQSFRWFKATTPYKMDCTLWKGMKYCAKKVPEVRFGVAFDFDKMLKVKSLNKCQSRRWGRPNLCGGANGSPNLWKYLIWKNRKSVFDLQISMPKTRLV